LSFCRSTDKSDSEQRLVGDSSLLFLMTVQQNRQNSAICNLRASGAQNFSICDANVSEGLKLIGWVVNLTRC
jgi:hypothetical protein